MYNRTDPRAIHETIIRDIVDIATDIKNTDELQFMIGKGNSMKSIAASSSNLTIVFPNVVSRSMDPSVAMMITKAQERKAVSMLQMLFSAFQVTDAKDAMEYISKFHTNLKIDDNVTVDRFISTMDSIAKNIGEGSGLSLDNDMYEAIKEDMKNLSYYLPESTNESALNDYKYSRLNGGYVVMEADNTSDANAQFRMNRNVNTTQKIDSPSQETKNSADFFRNQILDSDIKKANELMPTMMTINMIIKNGEDTRLSQVAVIGVKVKMYPADSVDIIDRIKAKNQDGNGLNNFIRATTREISFWKDLIFAINKAKIDALGSSRRGGTSPVWKLLERRALKSRIRRTFRFTNDATAITFLTVTKDEVEYLKKMENLNLDDERMARRIMEAFNLMGITIVNEALESADFIYDTGDDLYETITFTSLERESSDSTYKRVVNLMSRMH